MFHPLQKAPVSSFEFQSCDRILQAEKFCVNITSFPGISVRSGEMPSHWSGHELRGSLIPIDPHAFVRKCLLRLVA